MSDEIKKGNRAQEYRKAHLRFLEEWANGLDPLEITLLLGLSKTQLAKHMLDAYQVQAKRTIPHYSCIFWEDLPALMQRILTGQKGDIFRVEGDSSGVTITKFSISLT